MSIEVELPTGEIVEFPDGTPPEAMKSAMRKHVAKTMAPKPPPALPLQGQDYSPAGDFVRDPKTGAKFRNATDFTTDMQNLGAGVGKSVDGVLDGVTQLYLKATGQNKANEGLEANIAEKRRLDKPLKETGMGTLGEVTGDIAMTAIPAAKAFQATRALPRAMQTIGGIGASGAAAGAYEALKPTVGPNESRGENAAYGFGAGAGGQVIGNTVGRLIRGAVPVSRQAQNLPQDVFDESTLGQVADRTSFMGRMMSGTEEKLKSLPLTGAVIENARNRGVNAWRNNVMQRAAPEGFTPPVVGGRGNNTTMRDAVDATQEEFGRRYSGALQGQSIGPSSPFEQRVLRVTTDPRAGLTQAQQEEIRAMTMNYYQNMFSGTPNAAGATPLRATAETAKEFESFLRAQARQYRRSQAPQADNMANAYEALSEAWTPAYRSQLPLATRQALRPTDRQYAPFKTAERASTYVGNEEGAFTPSQLLNAVKARTPGTQFARGDGLLQDAADQGKVVYGDKVPNSGTADRTANMGAALGAVIDPFATGSALALGSSAIPLMTTRAGKNFMTGRTRAQMLMQRLRMDEGARLSGVPIGEAMLDGME